MAAAPTSLSASPFSLSEDEHLLACPRSPETYPAARNYSFCPGKRFTMQMPPPHACFKPLFWVGLKRGRGWDSKVRGSGECRRDLPRMLDSECLVAACASLEFLIQSFSHECGIFGSTPSSHNIVRNLIKRVTQGRYLVELELCGGNFVVISVTNFNFVFIWA